MFIHVFISQIFHIQHRLKIILSKYFSYHGYSNLIGSDVHVWTDD